MRNRGTDSTNYSVTLLSYIHPTQLIRSVTSTSLKHMLFTPNGFALQWLLKTKTKQKNSLTTIMTNTHLMVYLHKT